jgi:maltose/moltooligosaccharide transporter
MHSFQQRLSNGFYAMLALPATAMGFALSVQIAALSWILNTKFGLDIHSIGIVWMAGPLAGIFGQVIIGVVSDQVWFWNGRRRPFILIGGTVAALMLLALPNIGVINDALGLDSIVGVAITVALTLDLAINISFNPTRSVIADVTPVGDQRTKGYTWMQTISGFFGVLAYLIGAFVGNIELIYLSVFMVFGMSVIPIFFVTEPRELNAADASGATAGRTDTNMPEFIKICLAHGFSWLGIQTMFVYSFFYIKETVFGHAADATLPDAVNNEIGFTLGIAFAVLNTVGFILPALVLEPITERIGRVRTHFIAIAIMSLGYVGLILFGTTVTAFFVMMGVVGIGWAAVVSLPFAIMSEHVNQGKMGLFMGLFNLSVVLPQLLASFMGGWLGGFEDRSVIYIVSAVSLAISAVLWLRVKDTKGTGKVMASGH